MAVKGANGDILDLESSLLQQFSCLGTQDKDVLINEFQKLLSPNQLSAEGCAFFLDMNNWNLQQAICSYFDLDCPKELTGWLESVPSMTLIKDVTIGEGEEVPPNTRFIKTWRIQNSGTVRWPPDCSLRFVDGHLMGHCERVLVDPLEPGQIVDISVEMISPAKPGDYQGIWRMSSASGHFFGEPIWVIITVAEGGLLSLTQQMDSFHQLGNHPNHVANKPNPFEANFRRHLENASIKQSDQISEPIHISPTSNDMRPTSYTFASGSAEKLSSSSTLHQTSTEVLKDTLYTNSSPSQSWNHSGTTSNVINPCPRVNSSSLDHAANMKEESSSQLNRSNNLPPTPPPSEDMML